MLYDRNDERIKNDPNLRTKLQMLELAEESGNVSYACRRAGYSRDTFYRIRKLFQSGGIDALQHMSKGKPNLKNRIAAETEAAVLALATEHPEFGQIRVSMTLAARGFTVSAAGVRNVWVRNDLATVERRMREKLRHTGDIRLDRFVENTDSSQPMQLPEVA